MTAPPVPTPPRRRRARPTVAAAIGWTLMAGLLSLGALADRTTRGDDDVDQEEAADAGTDSTGADSTERHLPVLVQGDWLHHPVRVLGVAPPTATPAMLAKGRGLPKPFAGLKLAATPLIMPRLRLPRVLEPRFPALRSLLARARPGEPVHVTLSAYCLRGRTRRGTPVRPGIIAADPRVFPLARHVELYAAGRYLGRYRVEDTGSAIRGTRIDIWTPDCADAVRFGMRSGVAELVAVGN